MTISWMLEVWMSRAFMVRFDFKQMTQNLFSESSFLLTFSMVGRRSSVIGVLMILNPAVSEDTAGPWAPSSPSIFSKNLETSSAAEVLLVLTGAD